MRDVAATLSAGNSTGISKKIAVKQHIFDNLLCIHTRRFMLGWKILFKLWVEI